MMSVAELRELLTLYAQANDCPVCFATPELIETKVERFSGSSNYSVSGGRWYVEHDLSCDVRRALHHQGGAERTGE